MLWLYTVLFCFFLVSPDKVVEQLRCKPRTGCAFPKCDPAPDQWRTAEGVSLFVNDYPILCHIEEAADGPVLLYGENLKSLTESFEELKSETRNLKSRLAMTERKGLETGSKIAVLENENSKMKDEIEKLKADLNALEEESSETTKDPSCEVTVDGFCYWTYFDVVMSLTPAKAKVKCAEKKMTLAYFPTELAYNKVVEKLRSKIPSGWGGFSSWTGVEIDTNTGKVTKPSGTTYTKWSDGYPKTSDAFKSYKYVNYLVRARDEQAQGMRNGPANMIVRGAICQKTVD